MLRKGPQIRTTSVVEVVFIDVVPYIFPFIGCHVQTPLLPVVVDSQLDQSLVLKLAEGPRRVGYLQSHVICDLGWGPHSARKVSQYVGPVVARYHVPHYFHTFAHVAFRLLGGGNKRVTIQ